MVQPGLDRQLAQIRYADFLEEAARERADRKQRPAAAQPASRRLALALAPLAPLALWIFWLWATH